MRAYMVWAGQEPHDGASLALCATARQAKALAWRHSAAWLDGNDFTDIRVQWMRDADVAWLLARYGVGFTESPDACGECDLWHADALQEERWCSNCFDGVASLRDELLTLIVGVRDFVVAFQSVTFPVTAL